MINTAHQQQSFDQLLERVRACVPRLTKGKKAVLSALYRADMPLTAHEIYAQIGDNQMECAVEDKQESIDVATIYRNLEQFEKLHLINKTEHSNGGWRYTLTDKHHSHTISCVRCGKEMPVGACVMAEVENVIAQRTGFMNIHHIVNFTGSCPSCQHQ
jgi:Fe2+ or Zn2+ uptake regulation protein